jgi:hypothetical protein
MVEPNEELSVRRGFSSAKDARSWHVALSIEEGTVR